ncbi:beclin 1 [Apiospora phragmitis]|uniref:Beclin 1 n=1 Tax=Apiospora phragmitis TaxID=2905665 RepID=A0ABR1WSZ1_9PEZI
MAVDQDVIGTGKLHWPTINVRQHWRYSVVLPRSFTSSIETFDLHIKKPAIRTQLVPGPDSSVCPHSVLKVGLYNATGSPESWVLDPAGCQYGFNGVLVPYDNYLRERQCTISAEPASYLWTETKDTDYFESLPVLNRTAAQRTDRAVERKIRLHYASFVEVRFGAGQPSAAKSLLEYTSGSFEGQLDGLMEDLRKHMTSYMDEHGLYRQS